MAGHTSWKVLKDRLLKTKEAQKIYNECRSKMTDKVDPKAVRAWAVETGRKVGVRGRLDAKLIAEFVESNAGKVVNEVKETLAEEVHTLAAEEEKVEEALDKFGF